MIQANNDLVKFSAIGEKLIRVFHDENRRFSNYTITFEQLKNTLQSRRGQKNFIRTFGGTIDVSGTSESDAIQAMKNLAQASKGRIPSANVAFTQAVIDKATQFDFVDAVSYTVKETAKEVVKGIAEVGDTLITTGKMINLIFPIAVLAILYFVIKKKIA